MITITVGRISKARHAAARIPSVRCSETVAKSARRRIAFSSRAGQAPEHVEYRHGRVAIASDTIFNKDISRAVAGHRSSGPFVSLALFWKSVDNNASFANVRRDQQQGFAGHVIGADLVNPDFMKLAGAFGVEARRVSSPAAFKPVLAKALAQSAPYLIEVELERGTEASPWRFINPKPPS